MSEIQSYENVKVEHYGENTQIKRENAFLSDFKCLVSGD
jgi:hypothetical protein